MANCERNCGDCKRCVGAHAQLVIDELNQKLETMTAERDQARKTSAFNKDNHLAAEAEIVRLRFQVEKEHEVAGELQEGLRKQFGGFAAELDALDAKLKVANLQINDLLTWAKDQQAQATMVIEGAGDPENASKFHGRRFALMQVVEKLTGNPELLHGGIEKRICPSTTGTENQVTCIKEHGHQPPHFDGRLIKWRP